MRSPGFALITPSPTASTTPPASDPGVYGSGGFISRDCRALIEAPFCKRVFPHTRLNPKKSTEAEFETTRRGYRLATSVGGTLTGRGGDILIIDDPIKANDANSQVALTGADEWFHNTALSRLDSADSLVIVTMQRLHQKDLSGI